MGQPIYAWHRGSEVRVMLPGLDVLRVSRSAAIAGGRKLDRLMAAVGRPGPKESLPLFADVDTKKTLHVVLAGGRAHFRIPEDGAQVALWLPDAQRFASELMG